MRHCRASRPPIAASAWRFPFQSSQPLHLADLEPSILALRGVKRRIAHAVLAAQLGNWCPGLLLLQDPDDLLLRVPRPLHSSVPLWSGLYLLMADFSGSTSASPLEQSGFEPLVPLTTETLFGVAPPRAAHRLKQIRSGLRGEQMSPFLSGRASAGQIESRNPVEFPAFPTSSMTDRHARAI